MLPNLQTAEKKLRLKKMETAKEEFELQKLRLLHKIDNIDKELVIQVDAIDKLKTELGE